MDEFDSISPSYQGFMKHVLQKAVVQTRMPHSSTTEQLRRYATFIATSNNFDLLTDSTGSRRFICIEVKGTINYSQPINYTQLYAQALHAIRQDERYWFNREEEAYITESNRKFQQIIPEEEALLSCFRAPRKGEKYQELTCGEMLEKIKAVYPHFKYTNSSVLKLSRSLKNTLESRRTRRGVVYRVVEV